VMQRLWTEHY